MNNELKSTIELQKEFKVCPKCGCTTYREECKCPNCEYDNCEQCLEEDKFKEYNKEWETMLKELIEEPEYEWPDEYIPEQQDKSVKHAKNITIHNLRNEKPSKPYDIRVDRHNKILGNPFIMHNENEREKVIAQYNCWIHTTLTKELSYPNQKDRIVWNEIDRLLEIYKKYGKLRLFCWCAPKQCHAEIIVDLILTELNQGVL